MEDLVLYFSLKYNGDFEKIYKAIREKEPIDYKLKDKLFNSIKCNYVTLFSKDYPNSLKQISCPPFVLYYYGDLSLLNMKKVAIVGGRNCSDTGKNETKELVKDLITNDYCIISGLASGVDTVVHEEVILNNGHTIAILGNGIERCYPMINQDIYDNLKENQLIMSESPFDVEPTKKQLAVRNRLITGLCDQLIVSESTLKSSSMFAVYYALQNGKDVFCMPTSVSSHFQGTNELIKQGAKLFNNIKDLEMSF